MSLTNAVNHPIKLTKGFAPDQNELQRPFACVAKPVPDARWHQYGVTSGYRNVVAIHCRSSAKTSSCQCTPAPLMMKLCVLVQYI